MSDFLCVNTFSDLSLAVPVFRFWIEHIEIDVCVCYLCPQNMVCVFSYDSPMLSCP